MKNKEEFLRMADEIDYAELFEELNNLGFKGEIYETLKVEFLLNKIDIHWNNRLKVCIFSFFSQNKENMLPEKGTII